MSGGGYGGGGGGGGYGPPGGYDDRGGYNSRDDRGGYNSRGGPPDSRGGYDNRGSFDRAGPGGYGPGGPAMFERGMDMMKDAGLNAFAGMHKYVEEGPAGVSYLCFFSGIATAVVGVFEMFGYLFEGQMNKFVLFIYLFLFGLVSIVLEMDVQSMSRIPAVGRCASIIERWQHSMFDNAKFLTLLSGRGAFYIFIGVICVAQCKMFSLCPAFFVGLYSIAMGSLCLCMGWGINPVHHMRGGYGGPGPYGGPGDRSFSDRGPSFQGGRGGPQDYSFDRRGGPPDRGGGGMYPPPY
eukprot:gnl/TRDRNA2_/TRDRNA2_171081_c1_seq3.p1 gnl/TRDRNA2_/TRDRNA2_171081_c1~~gnl/TRDRNA2_/TRDRNA2_171081_c1_seq3.p1  ORF type:complete len:324 (-),score=51.16 gnl/TRDRNA2_/TRDRNA2_171081_c1_seq3:82-963(-)